MERRDLSDSQERKGIITTNADKRGAKVIIDVEDYIREANSQVGNPRGGHSIVKNTGELAR